MMTKDQLPQLDTTQTPTINPWSEGKAHKQLTHPRVSPKLRLRRTLSTYKMMLSQLNLVALCLFHQESELKRSSSILSKTGLRVLKRRHRSKAWWNTKAPMQVQIPKIWVRPSAQIWSSVWLNSLSSSWEHTLQQTQPLTGKPIARVKGSIRDWTKTGLTPASNKTLPPTTLEVTPKKDLLY